jgi:hypothetical protein
MQPVNRGAGPGSVDLIRDIGRSGACCAGRETLEHQLMRLSGDPLAVGDLIRRSNQPEQEFCRTHAMSGETTFAVAQGIGAFGSLDEFALLASAKRYECPEPALQQSIRPSAFRPSKRDLEEALSMTLHSESGLPMRVKPFGILVPTAFFVSVIVIGLLILFFPF